MGARRTWRRAVPAGAGAVVLVPALLLALAGCSADTTGEADLPPRPTATPAIDDPEEPEVVTPAASTSSPPASPDPSPSAEATPAQVSVDGTWAGDLEFTDAAIHFEDDESVKMASKAIDETLDTPYPIAITIRSAADGSLDATLVFDGGLTIEGTGQAADDGFEVTFAKAGDKEFKVGSSPPIEFTFTGEIGRGRPGDLDYISGFVTYKVFTSKGKPAWTESGAWSAERTP